jgi:dsDNA-specific endonuclease/ATPase MutS2
MSKFKIGDRVQALDDDFSGVVTGINAGMITIETTDGFTVEYLPSQLINMPAQGLNFGNFNPAQINREKEQEKKKFVAPVRQRGEIPPPEYDLHIEKLVKHHKRLNDFDILDHQTSSAVRHLEHAILHRIPRIIFIHGVGDGVLKAELNTILSRYDGVSYKDASFQKYGIGATEVNIRQAASL